MYDIKKEAVQKYFSFIIKLIFHIVINNSNHSKIPCLKCTIFEMALSRIMENWDKILK